EWSAFCHSPFDSFSCHSKIGSPNPDWLPGRHGRQPAILNPSDHTPHYAWTDLTYLLHAHHVSWAYYVFKGTEPDCENDASVSCKPLAQRAQTYGIWNPLPDFTDVHQDHQLGNVQSLRRFFRAARHDRLPAVSWIVPNGRVSEHPPGRVSAGQTYVTG